jgi:hypothetical protein
VPVPVFCCFCISEKLYKKYSQNWMKQSPKSLFCCHVHEVQRRDGDKPGGGRTMPWCGPTPGHAWLLCGSLGRPPTSPFRLYIAPDAKTLEEEASIHEKFHSATAIEDKFRGTEVSIPAPCREGELPPEPSPSTPPPFSSPLLTPMMRRE